VNVTDSEGETPLHSIILSHYDVPFDNECGCDGEVGKSKIKILLDAGAQVNARDERGRRDPITSHGRKSFLESPMGSKIFT